MIVISNTSPISNLAAIGHLELLQQLYSNIIIPPAVYQELINSSDTAPATLAVQTLSWIQTQPVSDRVLLETLQSNLDPGEAEAITLAVEIHADRLIIDERRGRNEAIRLGLQVTGLLGISVSG
jgi:predicted nucleic acid-binding protein